MEDPARSHAFDIKLWFYRFGFGQVCDPAQDLTLASCLSFFLRRALANQSSYLESGCKVHPDPILCLAIACYTRVGWEGSSWPGIGSLDRGRGRRSGRWDTLWRNPQNKQDKTSFLIAGFTIELFASEFDKILFWSLHKISKLRRPSALHLTWTKQLCTCYRLSKWLLDQDNQVSKGLIKSFWCVQ
jgi:hypothetical protein